MSDIPTGSVAEVLQALQEQADADADQVPVVTEDSGVITITVPD